MLYIMRRTQMYIEDDLWEILHAKAQLDKTTVSDLLRTAAREKYACDAEQRATAMMAIVGMWKDRDDLGDTEEYIRNLRRGDRRRKMLASIAE
jgi:ABC-type multidrug transport system ATPase subunit